MLTIWNTENKRSFNVRVVMQGDSYGSKMRLINDEKEPLVEFYDASYDFDKDPDGKVLGQFISRYGMSSLAGEYDGSHGLCLDLSDPESWSIDKTSMKLVNDWLLDIANKEGIVLEKWEFTGAIAV
jgi:hypothetical protein